MKKIVAISLLLLFSLTSGGLFAVFNLMRSHAKTIARQIIQHETLDFIVFQDLEHNTEIVWQESDKEFLYKGKLYDIAKTEIRNDHSYYYCYDDQKETVIAECVNLFAKGLKDNQAHNSENLILQLMFCIVQVFIPGEGVVLANGFNADIPHISGSAYCMYYPVCISEILLPPPRA